MRNSLVRFGKRNVYRPSNEAFLNSFEDSAYNTRENPTKFFNLFSEIPSDTQFQEQKKFLPVVVFQERREDLNNYLTSKFL